MEAPSFIVWLMIILLALAFEAHPAILMPDCKPIWMAPQHQLCNFMRHLAYRVCLCSSRSAPAMHCLGKILALLEGNFSIPPESMKTLRTRPDLQQCQQGRGMQK
eukprot:1161983-Pelagomonas_calceolata.AAC.4